MEFVEAESRGSDRPGGYRENWSCMLVLDRVNSVAACRSLPLRFGGPRPRADCHAQLHCAHESNMTLMNERAGLQLLPSAYERSKAIGNRMLSSSGSSDGM